MSEESKNPDKKSVKLSLKKLVAAYPDIFVKTSETDFEIKADFQAPEDEDLEIKIKDGQTLSSSDESKKFRIKCTRIHIVNSTGNRLMNLILDCSAFFQGCTNLVCAGIDVVGFDSGTGGGIVLNNSKGIFHDCHIKVFKVPALYVENESMAIIGNSTFDNSDATLVVCSLRCQALFESCVFHKTTKNALYASESEIVIKDSEFSDSGYPAIYGTSCTFFISDTKFSKIEQNGMTFSECPNVKITGCQVFDVQSSGISISQSNAIVENCNIHHIEGNGIYISEASNVELTNNIVSNCKFPSFAILLNCDVTATGNTIKDMEKSAVCIRSAATLTFKDNMIQGAGECGLSISDSKNILIMNNKIMDTAIAGIESYNSSSVDFTDNELTNCGQYCFLVYSGAYINAVNNKITNCKKALCQLRFKGKARVVSNKTDRVIPQYDGTTTGDYFFCDNGQPPITNMKDEAERLGITQDPIIEENGEMCIKCKKEKRNCFLQSCGHYIYCHKCGEESFMNGENCPLCRFPIEGITTGFSSTCDNTCTICATNEPNGIVFPCGHTGVCADCLAKWFSSNDSCPVCRVSPAFFKKIEKNI